jgi:hypothetical protein
MNSLELSLFVEESKFIQSASIRHCYEIYEKAMSCQKKATRAHIDG